LTQQYEQKGIFCKNKVILRTSGIDKSNTVL
jgi:hypothetical protein